MSVLPACTLCACSAVEARREHWIPRQLWTTWALRTKSGSCKREATAQNYWAISPTPPFFLSLSLSPLDKSPRQSPTMYVMCPKLAKLTRVVLNSQKATCLWFPNTLLKNHAPHILSLCSPSCSGTSSVEQAGPEWSDPPASASLVQQLKMAQQVSSLLPELGWPEFDPQDLNDRKNQLLQVFLTSTCTHKRLIYFF